MVPTTQSLLLSKRGIYPAGRRRGESKHRFQPIPFTDFFSFGFQEGKKHLREHLVRSLEVHEPSWAQSPPEQAKHEQPIQDAPCWNEAAAQKRERVEGKTEAEKDDGICLGLLLTTVVGTDLPGRGWWDNMMPPANGSPGGYPLVGQGGPPMYREKNLFWCKKTT